jgi:diguanylate cyclase (GGDEF)-like protein/PAS domain S-box-containing protein
VARRTAAGHPISLVGPAEPPATKRTTRVEALGHLSEALDRLGEAEDTLRAIGAGEIDAFVVSEGGSERRVFTLSTADRPYRKFVEQMRDGAATLSSSGLILYANERLARMLGCPRETLVGSELASFVDGDLPHELSPQYTSGEAGITVELQLIAEPPALVPVLAGISPLDVDGDLLTCVTFTDLSAQKEQEAEIARLGRMQADRYAELQVAQAALLEQATHDALTGLPNRIMLVDRIGQALAQATRTRRCTVVLFVDLDDFKHVNDTYGHAAGDDELRRVAERLAAELRPMDTVARLGGDEFVVLATDVEHHSDGIEMGIRLVEALSRRAGAGDRFAPTTASVGIAISSAGAGTAESLLHEADMAMYFAKSRGGERAEVFDEALGADLRARVLAQQLIASALDERRVAAYYQPIIELAHGTIVAFEALARVIAPDGSILPPAAFIPAAEASGLIASLGASMLRVACATAGTWTATTPIAVAVNLSPRQFDRGDLPEIIERTLEAGTIRPGDLHLELTETTIIDLRSDVLDQLQAIRELGVEIGLDDFGTGYASLTHLRRLPLSFVKIDQTFVQGIGTDVGDDRIVASVIDLAANLGLRSIAEGVETVAQLARLRELGATQAQGYLIGRPVPAGELTFGIPTVGAPAAA